MTKLHELLAVDASLKGQAEQLRKEMILTTFEKKKHHFSKKLVTYRGLEAGSEPEIREQSEIQTSVQDEIHWLSNILGQAINTGFAIDVANTHAKGSIILEDGTVIASDVPTTALMQLGHRIKEITEMIHAIPTLDPAKGFVPDPNEKNGVFKAREVRKNHTAKVQEPLVMYAATEKHPAQTQLIIRDVVIGTSTEQEWSSLISTNTKAKLLEQVENLGRAVAKARSRANGEEIDMTKINRIGDQVLGYIFGPLA